MSKRILNIDVKLLQNLINEHENSWSTGQTTFYEHITNTYNNAVEGFDKISPSTLQLRVTQGIIKCNVKKGIRGDFNKEKSSQDQKDTPPLIRKSKKAFNKDGIKELSSRKGISDWAKNLIRKAKTKPNLRNRVNLKCAECVCFSSMSEIKLCNINSCPLWDVRPYQGTKND